jgi:hypothetical protein
MAGTDMSVRNAVSPDNGAGPHPGHTGAAFGDLHGSDERVAKPKPHGSEASAFPGLKKRATAS